MIQPNLSHFLDLTEDKDIPPSPEFLNLLKNHASTVAGGECGAIIGAVTNSRRALIQVAQAFKTEGRKGRIYWNEPPQRSHKHDKLPILNTAEFQAILKRYDIEGVIKQITPSMQELPRFDLLWLDIRQNNTTLEEAIRVWEPLLNNEGILIINEYADDNTLGVSLGELLPFSRYRTIYHIHGSITLQRLTRPRRMYLCGGLQGSGSTLLSWCFLQRSNLDGVSDMHNTIIHQDFSRVTSEDVWVKMTIGAFRLSELIDLYKAQGWDVIPLLIQRDIDKVLATMRRIRVDGATADDPPIFIRVSRYFSDLDMMKRMKLPIIIYEGLIKNPVEELKVLCERLELPWDEGMIDWKKPVSAIAYPGLGSDSFHSSRKHGGGLLDTIAAYQCQRKYMHKYIDKEIVDPVLQALSTANTNFAPAHSSIHKSTRSLLPGVSFQRSRRYQMEKEIVYLKAERQRIYHHVVLGAILRFWKRFVNPSLPISANKE